MLDELGSRGVTVEGPDLALFFEASSLLMGVVELTPDGDILHLVDNAAAIRFLGLPPVGAPGRTARALGVPQPAIDLWIRQYRDAARIGAPVSFDYVHEPWPGGARVLSVQVHALPGASPRFGYLCEDVTERRRTEESLRLEETRLEMALSAARLGDWSWDAATNLVTFSPRAAEIFGVPPGQAFTWDEIVDRIEPEDQPLAYGAVATTLEGGAYEIEYRFRRPLDDRPVWIGVRGRAIFGPEGKPVARIGMAWDQTRLKTIQARLQEESRRAAALESAKSFVLELSDALRPITAPREILAEAARRLGERLAARGVSFRHVGGPAEEVAVRAGYACDGEAPAPLARLGDLALSARDALAAGGVTRLRPGDAPGLTTPILALLSSRSEGAARLLIVELAADAEPSALDLELIEETARRAWTEADRTGAEEALRESELRFRLFTDAAREGVAIHDGRVVLDCSPAYARIFGFRAPEELVGTSIWNRTAKEAFVEARARLGEGLEGRFESQGRRRDGEAFPCEIFVRNIDWNGVPARMALVRDLSEIRRAEADLRDSRAQLEAALESTTDSIFVLSSDWRFTFLNRRAVDHIAEGRDLLGRDIWEAFPEAVGGALWNAYQTCMRQRRETEAEQYYEPLGRAFRARAFPTVDGGVAVYFRDVTEERAAEARLAETEAMLRGIGTASPDLLYAKDLEGRMVYANPATLGVLGRPEEEVIGRSESEILADPAQAKAIREADRQVLAAGASQQVEEVVTDARLGEIRIFQSRKTPLRDPVTGEVVGLVGVSRDVTEQRAAETALAELNLELEAKVEAAVRERRAAQDRLAQAEKLTALGQLAGGVAHDVNNVLQSVLGASSLISRRANDPEAVARLAGMIEDAARRGGSLTRKLLAFARRGELRAERIEPAPLLESLLEILAHTLGAGILIDAEVEPGVPAVLADRAQLEAALINLATNGRDAMPQGGRLRLAARRGAGADAARLDAPPETLVGFSVADEGGGIDPEILPRVLEPFFTTKPQDKGTGLGLPMARSFAEQSGGALTLESEPGVGTVVTLWLPIAPAGARNAEGEPYGPEGARRQARALLVDDEFLVRQVLAEQLAEAGFEVTQAEDGATALAILRGGEAADVLVTDRSMPGMDGVELIRRARELRPDLPAVLLTGFAGDAEAEADGRFPVLRKPVPAFELAARLRALVDG